jgi:hypothetical protein
MKLVFWLIAIWILYRLIAHVILPLTESGKKAKRQFNDIKNRQTGAGSAQTSQQKASIEKDYIEFEEINS